MPSLVLRLVFVNHRVKSLNKRLCYGQIMIICILCYIRMLIFCETDKHTFTSRILQSWSPGSCQPSSPTLHNLKSIIHLVYQKVN